MNFRRFAIIPLLFFSSICDGQSCSPSDLKPLPGKDEFSFHTLFARNPKNNLHLCVDTRAAHPGIPDSPLQIGNHSTVELNVYRNPVDKCTVNYNPASIAPAANPLATVFGGLITGKPLTPNLVQILPESVCDTPLPQPPASSGADFKNTFDTLSTLDKNSSDLLAKVSSDNDDLPDAFDNVRDLAACKEDICDPDNFDVARKELETFFGSATLASISPDTLQSLVQQTQGALSKLHASTADEEQWLKVANSKLTCIQDRISQAQVLLNINKAVSQPVFNALTAIQTPPVAHADQGDYFLPDVFTLPLYANTKITPTISCTNQITGQVAPQVSWEIDYQNPGFVSASAGIVVSTLGQHTIGTRNKNVPSGNSGFTTFFAVTSQSPVQVIPFSLLNLYLSGSNKVNINLSGGIGINPYNSTNQVEYFVGPSINIHNVLLSPGVHIGRFQRLGGGFKTGDPVPAGWSGNTPVPVDLNYTAHFGIGVTFKIH